jgi:hypothetical protein
LQRDAPIFEQDGAGVNFDDGYKKGIKSVCAHLTRPRFEIGISNYMTMFFGKLMFCNSGNSSAISTSVLSFSTIRQAGSLAGRGFFDAALLSTNFDPISFTAACFMAIRIVDNIF